VRYRGIHLGHPVDVVLDTAATRVVAFDVLCGDEEHRVLPLAVAVVGVDEIVPESALVLVDERDSRFYREQGRWLRDLRGRAVMRGGRRVGALRDVLVDEDGALTELVVAAGDEERSLPLDGLRIEPPPPARGQRSSTKTRRRRRASR
jgi:hypothetical protein